MALTRRQFLASSGAGATALAAQSKRPPNIVWIMADDLGIGDVGCYGQKKIRTPNIDKLAAGGMRFLNAYAGCTVCAPARSTLMTGYHMGHTSVRTNPGGVPILESDVTVAQVLKGAGYRCGGYGKWGLGDVGTSGVPSKHGFDDFFGYLNQVHAHWYYTPFLIHNEKEYPLPGNTGGKRTTYSADVIDEKALEFIAREKDHPFFLYMPTTVPHWELLVPEDSFKEYDGKFPETPWIDKAKHYADQPKPHATYAGMVTRMDRDIGRVIAALEKYNLIGNTIVFFTSDNGGALELRGDHYFESTGPYRGHKQNFYEGGIRTPLIASWPGHIKAGSTTDLICCFYDFMPTAAELAGVEAPKGIDGISIVPTLLGKSNQKKHEYLYWELPRHNGKTGEFLKETPMQAMRMGDWKAVRPKPDGPVELYNLKTDVGETKDVGAANPKILAKMEGLLKTARVEPRPQKDPPTKPERWKNT
jgi:arylsulfatase A